MKLRHSYTSPYVRKVHDHRLGERHCRRHRICSPPIPGRPIPICRTTTRWAKCPALITDGGEHLYNSPVICEYLDSLHDGAKLFPSRRRRPMDGAAAAGLGRRHPRRRGRLAHRDRHASGRVAVDHMGRAADGGNQPRPRCPGRRSGRTLPTASPSAKSPSSARWAISISGSAVTGLAERTPAPGRLVCRAGEPAIGGHHGSA